MKMLRPSRWGIRLWLCALFALALPALAHAQFGNLFSSGSNEPLPAEQAFPFTAEWTADREITARWDTQDGYYLYRDKFSFELSGTDAQIVDIALPDGEVQDDPYFGRVAVLYEPAVVTLTLDRMPSGEFELVAGYQGCAEMGLCYPPLQIAYPFGSAAEAVTTVAATDTMAPSGSPGPSEQTRLGSLLEDGSLPLILASFFGAGLLLAFTACLYPMIPILSGLIAGDRAPRTGRRAFALSMVYVQATAITYAAAGVAAGLSGQAIQADLQSPWVLGTFAAVFVFLALSMFGFYELQLPASWQTRIDALSRRQRGGTFIGVGIMGMLSALIVGACSGPALIAALMFIANTGDAVLGGVALYTLALGMGVPLLLIGTAAGKWLPRSGPWMDTVKRVFGVGFLAVALWMVERILPGSVGLALWGALLLGCAVYLGAFDSLSEQSDGTARLRKFGGVVLLIWGSLILIGAAAGSRDFWQPLAAFGTSAQSEAQLGFAPVKTVAELERALIGARESGRPAVMDVYADWCVYCVQLEERTFTDAGVRDTLQNAVLLRADVTAMDDEDRALLSHLNVFLPPAVIFYDRQGLERADYRVAGFMPARRFEAWARDALMLR